MKLQPTILHILESRATEFPDKIAFTNLKDGEQKIETITYQQLWQRTLAIAQVIQNRFPKCIGKRAVLIYEPGLNFLTGLLGTLQAGIIAVPIYPPDLTRLRRTVPRLKSIIADCSPEFVFTSRTFYAFRYLLRFHVPDISKLNWLSTSGIRENIHQRQFEEIRATPNDIAYLQYTSGSTGNPKGVMVSHENVICNMGSMNEIFQLPEGTNGVSWLPPYHDMGLICQLASIERGGQTALMSPLHFLQNPLRWLHAISKFNAGATSVPNFGLELTLKAAERQRDNIPNLSSLQVLGVGAEPVRKDTVERFQSFFSRYGLKSNAIRPVYGAAEATLQISALSGTQKLTFGRPQTDNKDSLDPPSPSASMPDYAGCGLSASDHVIKIVDPESRVEIPDGSIGEIWFAGKSVAKGYWNNPKATNECFNQEIKGTKDKRFLRTGDLGFKRHGNLFIAGRLKDLIIVNGTNHYPQDIEFTVEHSHAVLRKGCCAVFSLEKENREIVVVVQEVSTPSSIKEKKLQEIYLAIRKSVSEVHELQVAAITLVHPKTIPKTSSGKIQRSTTKNLYQVGKLHEVARWNLGAEEHLPIEQNDIDNRREVVTSPKPQSLNLADVVASEIAEFCRVDLKNIDYDKSFFDFGIDSAAAVTITGRIEEILNRKISPTLLWNYRTINSLARYLQNGGTTVEGSREAQDNFRLTPVGVCEPIAIIGMACRFPGARNLETFFELLADGRSAISLVESSRHFGDDWSKIMSALRADSRAQSAGLLESIDEFDPEFFGILPREADYMDPQQRLLLEVAWEAIENSGYSASALRGSDTGVFIGMSSVDYSHYLINGKDHSIDPYMGTGISPSIASGRISYLLGLRGPAITIDTACSSSLMATHLAMRSIRDGESKLALVGGVNLILSPLLTAIFSKANMLSPTGKCHTFDAAADGYVRGEGCGVVVLKQLNDAIRDGDHIYSTILGSATNQDGASNGLTAPNGLAQEAVIRSALRAAGVNPSEISYLEAHGTGTPLGDPIEIEAASRAYGSGRSEQNNLWIGSVKTNIGHLEAAAGIAGIIKVALSLENKIIPAHLNYSNPNPNVNWDALPVQIPINSIPWEIESRRRIAGVSSFGFSGTNVHLLLAESEDARAMETLESSSAERAHTLTISTKSPDTLAELGSQYLSALASSRHSINDICFSSNTGRDHFDYRLAIIGERIEEIENNLRVALQDLPRAQAKSALKSVQRSLTKAFVFSGQGLQYEKMGKGLFDCDLFFRENMIRCEQSMAKIIGTSILDIMFSANEKKHSIHDTRFTQPALFALQYSLAQTWIHYGIIPDAVIGHSIGEYAAACVAGVLAFDDAVDLVCHRASLMGSAPSRGSMARIVAPERQVRELMSSVGHDKLSIAAVNDRGSVVIAGETSAVEDVLEQFRVRGIETKRLNVSHAFHSQLMDSVVEQFGKVTATKAYTRPQVQFVSTVFGAPADDAVCTSNYWAKQLREPVRFIDGVEWLDSQQIDYYLEIGPAPLLAHSRNKCFSSLKSNVRDDRQFCETLAGLFELGETIQWNDVWDSQSNGIKPRRCPLPTNIWQRKKYWMDNTSSPSTGSENSSKRLVYNVQWQEYQSGSEAHREDKSFKNVVLFVGQTPPAHWQTLVSKLGSDVATYHSVNIESDEFLRETMLQNIESNSGPIHATRIFFVIPTLESPERSSTKDMLSYVHTCCGQLLYLFKMLNGLRDQAQLHLCIVTNNAVKLNGDQVINLNQSSVWGLFREAIGEFSDSQMTIVDVSNPGASQEMDKLVDLVTLRGSNESQFVIRGQKCFVPCLQETKTSEYAPEIQSAHIRSDATYVVTGGLGGLGQRLVDWLIERGAKHVAVIARNNPNTLFLSKMDDLNKRGIQLQTFEGDVSDIEALHGTFRSIQLAMPKILGIFHCAGTYNDGFLVNQDWKQFESVYKGKAVGAWNLHLVSRDLALDFFVLFSSAASIFGFPGQGFYPGANAFLDSLAHYRNQNGLCALSINWGPWADYGRITQRSDLLRLQGDKGINLLDADVALRILSKLLGSKCTQVCVIDFDARKYLDNVPAALHPILRRQNTGMTRSSRIDAISLPTNKNERKDFLVHYIATQAMKIARITAATIPIDQPLRNLGFDSLMALELKTVVENQLRLELPIQFLMKGPSIEILASELAKQEPSRSQSGVKAAELPAHEVLSAPLTPMQKGIWLEHQLDTSGSAYNLGQAYEILGNLDLDNLERSFAEIVNRHKTLQSGIIRKGTELTQEVQPRVDFKLNHLDLTTSGHATIEHSVEIIDAEISRKFDLSAPPLLRVTVAKLAKDRHILIVTAHHLVADGVSFRNMISELKLAYFGQNDQLPKLTISYFDYAKWLQESLADNKFKTHLDFWRAKLAGCPLQMDLPKDFEADSVVDTEGESFHIKIDTLLHERLKTYSRNRGVTSYTVLLAAFKAALFEFGQMNDVVVGSPYANRTQEGVVPLIGTFVNTVILRTRLEKDLSFDEIVARVHQTVSESFPYFDLPYQSLVEGLGLTGRGLFSPWLDINFGLQPDPKKDLGVEGLTIREIPYSNNQSKFSISVLLLERDKEITGTVEFRTKLYRHETIKKLIASFLEILEVGLKKYLEASSADSIVEPTSSTEFSSLN